MATVVVSVDGWTAAHALVALVAHRERLRRDRIEVPPGLAVLEDLFRASAHVSDRPEPLSLDVSLGSADAAPVLLVPIDEAARRMSVSVSTVERLVRSGELPSRTFGRARRIHVDDLEACARGEGSSS